jgi:hypothetical protein
MHIMAVQSCEEGMMLLLERGPAIEVQDAHGWTPLMCAVRTQSRECTKLLLELNAATDLKDYRDHATALHIAAVHDEKNMVPLLLLHGAAPDAVDKRFNLPHQVANDLSLREMLFRAYEKVHGPFTEGLYYSNGMPLQIVGEDPWAPPEVAQALIYTGYASVYTRANQRRLARQCTPRTEHGGQDPKNPSNPFPLLQSI